MPKYKPSRYQVFACPVCGAELKGPQGLAAHVRHSHPEHYARYGVGESPATQRRQAQLQPAEQPAEQAAPPPPPPPPPHFGERTTEPSAATPLDLLDRALTDLEGRAEAIRVEVARLESLRGEAAEIAKRVEAIRLARRAFVGEQGAATEHGTTAAGAA